MCVGEFLGHAQACSSHAGEALYSFWCVKLHTACTQAVCKSHTDAWGWLFDMHMSSHGHAESR